MFNFNFCFYLHIFKIAFARFWLCVHIYIIYINTGNYRFTNKLKVLHKNCKKMCVVNKIFYLRYTTGCKKSVRDFRNAFLIQALLIH